MQAVIVQSVIAGLATVIGAAIALVVGKPSPRMTALLLGFASGVMLFVVAIDLLPHALDAGRTRTAIGLILGILGCKLCDLVLAKTLRNSPSLYGKRRHFFRLGLMVALGIALHDLPEGLAIGAGFASSGAIGTSLAIAIGLHNIPEGLSVAVPLSLGGASKGKIIGLCLLISLVTPLGAIIGTMVSSISPVFIGLMLAYAAGAMTYVVADELIPTSYELSRSMSILGLAIGAVVVVLWL